MVGFEPTHGRLPDPTLTTLSNKPLPPQHTTSMDVFINPQDVSVGGDQTRRVLRGAAGEPEHRGGAAAPGRCCQGVEQLPAPWGATVLETRPAPGNSNRSVALLGEALSHALRVRRASWCVVVVVVSDNIFFLVKWAELGIESGLLAWPTRVVAITGLPTTRLHRIHLAYSHANSVVVVSNGNTPPRCTVWVHQPFSPPNARAAQVASWSPLRGLSLVPRKILFPDKFHK
ncbi:hypothetical protein E2C01_039271 [Portunus trituberculatus]|uniref:Uncharacterized protein n=1 Tax=Portunus trituberculatus TaxID=210409 RepID=A0A5B7FKX7_PORTR|nr:hypothetical protein [Portunus trituberculatus]